MRKIIHVDMDCFYAAIEIRDDPRLANKPVAVGGMPTERGVLCTCNYIARKWGVRSAMATAYALKLCPGLIVVPVNMHKYREAAKIIHAIFREYTALIEPLSLDEAYLDVSGAPHHQGSATLIAKEIRQKIEAALKITASAGVAPNKFLAKIASGCNKPDGLFVVPPHAVEQFIQSLPVSKLHGVGKVATEKLHALGVRTCLDLQKYSVLKLVDHFGKFGKQLYDQCRGIDHRPVEPNRKRKSLSVERTFNHDIAVSTEALTILEALYLKLLKRLKESAQNRKIKNQYIKIKFSNFKQTTLEMASNEANLPQYQQLLFKASHREKLRVRLIGIGVHFAEEGAKNSFIQQSFFSLGA